MSRSKSVYTGSYELYIFVTAPRADPYVNVLMHVLRQYAISAVHYVAVVEHDYTTEQMDERLSDVETNVGRLLNQLANGVYGHSKIATEPGWVTAYQECRNKLDRTSVRRVPISWNDLDAKLKEFIAGGPVMFDVTTLKKNLLVDVVALLLSRGFTAIFSFEVITSGLPRFDERGLIHALSPNGYRYRSLADSKHVQQARSRTIAHSMTFRTLLVLTSVVGFVVLIIQLFYPNSVLESVIVALGTTAAISGLLAGLRRTD